MWKAIGIIIAVIVLALVIQFVRFNNKAKEVNEGQTLVLPSDFFPFNGSYIKLDGKLTKS